MTTLAAVTFDCAHAGRLAAFWAAVFDRTSAPTPGVPEDFFARLEGDGAGVPTMMFIKVPEPKSAKNRMHLDLDVEDRAAEVERLVGLGATVVHDKDEYGTRWTTMADPEGNEFCVAAH